MKLFPIIFMTFLLILSVCIVGCTSTTSGQSTGDLSSSSCFKLSDVKSRELPDIRSNSWYIVQGNVTNICMKNFERVCVHATFYDSDNMVVASASTLLPQIQHGTTVWFGFNNLYEAGAGKNKATRHELVAYQLESKSVMNC